MMTPRALASRARIQTQVRKTPVSTAATTAASARRAALVAVGLERRARDVTVQDVVAELEASRSNGAERVGDPEVTLAFSRG